MHKLTGTWSRLVDIHDDETITTRAFQARVRACEKVLREGLTRATCPRVGHTLQQISSPITAFHLQQQLKTACLKTTIKSKALAWFLWNDDLKHYGHTAFIGKRRHWINAEFLSRNIINAASWCDVYSNNRLKKQNWCSDNQVWAGLKNLISLIVTMF